MISLATVSNAFKPSYALETSNTLKTFKALNRPEAPRRHTNYVLHKRSNHASIIKITFLGEA